MSKLLGKLSKRLGGSTADATEADDQELTVLLDSYLDHVSAAHVSNHISYHISRPGDTGDQPPGDDF